MCCEELEHQPVAIAIGVAEAGIMLALATCFVRLVITPPLLTLWASGKSQRKELFH
jgi:hypothetical protein